MTVEIEEKCCCGAVFKVTDTGSFGSNSASNRYAEFLSAHKICRERWNPNDPLNDSICEKMGGCVYQKKE